MEEINEKSFVTVGCEAGSGSWGEGHSWADWKETHAECSSKKEKASQIVLYFTILFMIFFKIFGW